MVHIIEVSEEIYSHKSSQTDLKCSVYRSACSLLC